MNWQTRYAECKERVTMNKYTGYSTRELVQLSEKLFKEGDRLGEEIDALIGQRSGTLAEIDQIIKEIDSRKKV